TSPPPPPPQPQRNTGLILLLAIGLPLLLLGGCGAVVMVLANTARETVVEADPPNLVMPSERPETDAPPAEDDVATPQPSTAAVGGALTLAGNDPGLEMTVTVTKLVDPATGDQFSQPGTGRKLVAVELTLENSGQAVYSDSPTNGAVLIDAEGQQYHSTLHDVQEGQSFGGSATINTGDVRKGVIVFEVPEPARAAKFQFTLNSGFADQTGEWKLG
ncbi:DUF4352 domain-containing protein, partial [Nonomuraea aridisoli]